MEAQNINFDVHYEADDFIVINKSPGLVMHPGSGCYDGTLANGLIYRFPELASLPRSGIVHRLDKDTSGVLLIARNEKFRNYFINQMQTRSIKKEYIAVVTDAIEANAEYYSFGDGDWMPKMIASLTSMLFVHMT